MSFIDHVAIHVPASRLDEVVKWYEAALAPLGISKQVSIEGKAYGLGTSPQAAPFWIGSKEGAETNVTGVHLAFKGTTHEEVDKFYEAAITAGGKDNGKPGPRFYHPNYYGAFVIDPVGNNVEVVDHLPHDK